VTSSNPLVISGAVEGVVDEAVLRRLVELAGARLGPVYGKKGKMHLQQKINGYNHAARISQWVVLVDLDHDANCAPSLRDSWLPKPSPYVHFRVSVRAVEAWLLADRESLSAFLGVPISRIPSEPEAESQPKRAGAALENWRALISPSWEKKRCARATPPVASATNTCFRCWPNATSRRCSSIA
jgi:hypothetical protein